MCKGDFYPMLQILKCACVNPFAFSKCQNRNRVHKPRAESRNYLRVFQEICSPARPNLKTFSGSFVEFKARYEVMEAILGYRLVHDNK